MAVIQPEFTESNTRGDFGHIVTWGPLGAGDEGAPISMIGSSRRTLQLAGTFAGGAKVTIEGSNNKVDWAPVTDIHGNRLVFAGAGISTLADLTLWLRPRVTAGTPSVTVIMLMRKTEAR